MNGNQQTKSNEDVGEFRARISKVYLEAMGPKEMPTSAAFRVSFKSKKALKDFPGCSLGDYITESALMLSYLYAVTGLKNGSDFKALVGKRLRIRVRKIDNLLFVEAVGKKNSIWFEHKSPPGD